MFYPFEVADPHSGLHYRLSDTRLAEVSLAPLPGEFSPGTAITMAPDPVWATSFANAPIETIAAVSAALNHVILGTRDLRPISCEALPDGRAKRHLAALTDLWRSLGTALPEGLETVRHVIDLPHGQFLLPLPVVAGSLDPSAPTALRALYDRLGAEFGTVTAASSDIAAPEGTRLRALQSGLTRPDIAPGDPDASLTVFGLRDPIACAEFAAARVRFLVDGGVPAREIAVLSAGDLPDLERAFTALGLSLSGLPGSLPNRDVAGETLLHLLLAKRSPTPAMALASLCLSPFMPWGAQTGRDLAEAVMRGRFSGRILEATPDHFALWQDLRQPAGSLPQLRLQLGRICDRLTDCADLRTRVLSSQIVLAGDGPPDWEAILRAVQVAPPDCGDPVRTLEGVSLWDAGETPWRPCRHLVIVDFTEGSYPARPRPNALFLDSEIAQIAAATGLGLRDRASELDRSLGLFERQLQAVRESVTCLVPWRDRAGVRLAPSAGLSLIARTVAGATRAADLIVDIASLSPADWPVRHHVLPPLPDPLPTPPDLRFGQRDLLTLRRDDSGVALPQSPSRLETLLVSPLAWLLGEIGAEGMGWEAETLDVMTRGNIAHHVFEHVFLADVAVPDAESLLEVLPDAFDAAVRRHAGFLRSSAWEMERAGLAREIRDAALRWRADLVALGARIVGNETWLHGDAHGILIRGKADTILALPDGSIVIVDHKKSGTAGRRRRMEAGWDLQVGLYGDMLTRPKRVVDDGLDAVIGRPVGIAYHLMNDGGLLTSGIALTGAAATRDMGTLVNQNAVERLIERLAQVGGGQIVLNTTADEKFFKNEAGFTPYALHSSPLVAAFMLVDEQ